MSIQKKIIFAGAVGQLEGVLHLPDAAHDPDRKDSLRFIAVVAHPLSTMGGTMDNKVVTTLANALVESGCATLRFNFRGVGKSDGNYDEGDGEMLDAIAATNFMRDRFPGLPLIGAGFSFGGYVQARAAKELQPHRLVLVAPAVGRFSPSTTLRTGMPEVPANTLLIHGDQDDVVSLQALLQWASPQRLPIIVLAGAGHFFHGRLTQLKQIVLQHMGTQT